MIKEWFELSKRYGAKELSFVCAIVFLYNMNMKTERKLETIEARLYDCLDDKAQMSRNAQFPIKESYKLLAILPNEKTNIRHTRTKRNV
jgi:hypothetical protein